jgi:hypothetical protein
VLEASAVVLPVVVIFKGGFVLFFREGPLGHHISPGLLMRGIRVELVDRLLPLHILLVKLLNDGVLASGFAPGSLVGIAGGGLIEE